MLVSALSAAFLIWSGVVSMAFFETAIPKQTTNTSDIKATAALSP